MSFDPMSSNTKLPARDAGSRRVEFRLPISTSQQASPTTTSTGELPQPLVAAINVSAVYIATLHSGLTSFLTKFATASLTAYSDYHQNKTKNKEMHLDPTHIPTSIKKIKLVLQPLEEVQASEGFKALQSELELLTEEFHRKLTTRIAKPLNILNDEARLRRFQLSVCTLLRNAAQGFIAQLNIENYDADTAIVDLLATSPGDILAPPLPTDINDFLRLYKEANKEKVYQLPLPTQSMTGIENIINDINNNRQPQTDHTNQVHERTPSTTTTGTNMATTNKSDSHSSPLSSITGTLDSGNASSTNQLPESRAHRETESTTTGVSSLAANPYAASTNQRNATMRRQVTPGTSRQELPLPPRPSIDELTRLPIFPPPPYTPAGAGIRGTDFHTASAVTAASGDTTLTYPAEKHNQFSYESHDNNGDSIEEDDTAIHQEIDALDLTSITLDMARQVQLRKMIHELFVNTIKRPIAEFHNTIIRQEEVFRIKRITAVTTKSCLTSKVAAKISAERPAERPVLAGLIREETEKTTAALVQKLKSEKGQLEYVKQQQSLIFQRFGQQQRIGHSPASHQSQRSKNYRGSNSKDKVWQRSRGTATTSSVAAETSPPDSRTVSSSLPTLQHGAKRKRHAGTPQSHSGDSAEAVDNVTAARRRRGNSRRPHFKHRGNEPT